MPSAKIFLLGVAAHILKWQHRDRRLFGQRQTSLTRLTPLALGPLSRIAGEGGPRRASDGVGEGIAEAVDAQRPRDVLEALLANVVELGVDLTAHLAEGVFRDADAAGLSEAL